jgi:cell division protein FtsW (lipid II flippase)
MAKIFSFIAVCIALLLPTWQQKVYQFESTNLDGSSHTLGKETLHSPKMRTQHLTLTAKGNSFVIFDLAADRRVTVNIDGKSIDAATKALVPDEVLYALINNQQVLLKSKGAKGVEVTTPHGKWFFNGALEHEIEGVLASCKGPYSQQKFIHSLAQHRAKLERVFKTNKVLRVGGSFNCATQAGLLGEDRASIVYIKGYGWLLTSKTPHKIFLKKDGEANWQPLSDFALFNEGVFTAGVTTYKAKFNANSGKTIIHAIASKPLSTFNHEVPANEKWQPLIPAYDEFSVLSVKRLWLVIGVGFIGLVIALYYWRSVLSSYQVVELLFSASCFVAISLFALEALRYSFILCVVLFAALIVMSISKTRHYVFVLFLIFGTLNQLLLSLTSETNAPFLKFNEQILLVSIFCTAVIFSSRLKLTLLRVYRSRYFPWVVKVTAGLLLLLMVTHFLIGSEVGISGFINPAELLKPAIAVVFAYLLSQMLPFQQSYLKRDLKRFMLCVALIISFSFFYMASLSDHSPLLILIAMFFMSFLYSVILLSSREDRKVKKNLRITLGITFVSTVAVIYSVFTAFNQISIDTFASAVPALERMKSYLFNDLALINGYQVNGAFQALSEAGWLPNHWGTALNLPAIHNDFAITHAFFKLGLLPVSLCISLLVAFCVYAIANSLINASNLVNSNEKLFIERIPKLAINISAGMLSAALLAHVAITLGSNIGVLPVMGQPLALFSFANSHLLFLATALTVINASLENKYA